MIVFNLIIDKSIESINTINQKKEEFWNISRLISNDIKVSTLIEETFEGDIICRDKINMLMNINEVKGSFMDYFFYQTSSNFNYITSLEILEYLKKYNRSRDFVPESSFGKLPKNVIREILEAELNFYELVEPLREKLKLQFDTDKQFTNFIIQLFSSISENQKSFESEIVEYSKMNRFLRVDQNFPIISFSKYSLLINYFCGQSNAGLAIYDFMSILSPSLSLLSYGEEKCENRMAMLDKLSFVQLNKIRSKQYVSLGNFDKSQEQRIIEKPLKTSQKLIQCTKKANEIDNYFTKKKMPCSSSLPDDFTAFSKLKFKSSIFKTDSIPNRSKEAANVGSPSYLKDQGNNSIRKNKTTISEKEQTGIFYLNPSDLRASIIEKQILAGYYTNSKCFEERNKKLRGLRSKLIAKIREFELEV